jgi:hypothetical protein
MEDAAAESNNNARRKIVRKPPAKAPQDAAPPPPLPTKPPAAKDAHLATTTTRLEPVKLAGPEEEARQRTLASVPDLNSLPRVTPAPSTTEYDNALLEGQQQQKALREKDLAFVLDHDATLEAQKAFETSRGVLPAKGRNNNNGAAADKLLSMNLNWDELSDETQSLSSFYSKQSAKPPKRPREEEPQQPPPPPPPKRVLVQKDIQTRFGMSRENPSVKQREYELALEQERKQYSADFEYLQLSKMAVPLYDDDVVVVAEPSGDHNLRRDPRIDKGDEQDDDQGLEDDDDQPRGEGYSGRPLLYMVCDASMTDATRPGHFQKRGVILAYASSRAAAVALVEKEISKARGRVEHRFTMSALKPRKSLSLFINDPDQVRKAIESENEATNKKQNGRRPFNLEDYIKSGKQENGDEKKKEDEDDEDEDDDDSNLAGLGPDEKRIRLQQQPLALFVTLDCINDANPGDKAAAFAIARHEKAARLALDRCIPSAQYFTYTVSKTLLDRPFALLLTDGNPKWLV